MASVNVPDRMNELTAGAVGSVDAATEAEIGPYRKSRSKVVYGEHLAAPIHHRVPVLVPVYLPSDRLPGRASRTRCGWLSDYKERAEGFEVTSLAEIRVELCPQADGDLGTAVHVGAKDLCACGTESLEEVGMAPAVRMLRSLPGLLEQRLPLPPTVPEEVQGGGEVAVVPVVDLVQSMTPRNKYANRLPHGRQGVADMLQCGVGEANVEGAVVERQLCRISWVAPSETLLIEDNLGVVNADDFVEPAEHARPVFVVPGRPHDAAICLEFRPQPPEHGRIQRGDWIEIGTDVAGSSGSHEKASDNEIATRPQL